VRGLSVLVGVLRLGLMVVGLGGDGGGSVGGGLMFVEGVGWVGDG